MIILGLDIGTNSIGWSLIDEVNQKIIQTGVKIFQEGVNRSPLGKEESKNTSRRLARQIRRMIFRKKKRKKLLIDLLQALNWCPTETEIFEMWKGLNPYPLRAKALDEKLSLFELGRVLYHLNQRRGFKSSRKSGNTNEEGAMYKGSEGKAGISELQDEIRNGGFRTLGEYLASLNPDDKRLRNRYTLRGMYEEEFELIWNKQASFYPHLNQPKDFQSLVQRFCFSKYHKKVLANDLKFFIKNYVIYHQRDLKSQKGLIGKCTFEPNKRKIAKSHLLFQEFRILDKLYAIRINGKGRTDSPLSKEEIQIAFDKLNVSKEMTIKDLLKWLKLTDFETNFKADDKLKGNRTAYELIKVFAKDWHSFDETQKNKIWEVIHQADDNDWLVQYGKTKWQLTEENAEKLRKVSFEDKYGEISHKALTKIVPLMKHQGLPYDKACLEAGYHHSVAEDKNDALKNQLTEPPNVRNPIVQQALFVLKKLVNTLIQEFALKPDLIRVELARELKMKREQRENILRDNKRRNDEHRRIVGILLEHSDIFRTEADIKSDDILKYKLYEECKEICPYTGKHIGIQQLYKGGFEIEHIIPYSRSLDDSFNNKTLCERTFNAKKGNRTPFEMLDKGIISQAEYDAIIERAKTFKREDRFNYKKFKKFLQKTVDTDFVNRQLNDTAYIATEAKKYLAQICDKVQISMGTATAELRHLWGLNAILNRYGLDVKNREDHRHHAVDAIVVALTSPGMLQKLSKFNEKGIRATEERFPKPWENFRRDVRDAVNQILVYQKRRKRVRGKLHEETFYRAVLDIQGTHQTDTKGMKVYSKRKALESLTEAEVHKIADKVIRDLVKNRIREKGVNPDADKFKIPVGCFLEPLYMPTKTDKKIQIKKVRLHEPSSNRLSIRTLPQSRMFKDVYADPGGNHHIIIYEDSKGKRYGKVTSLFEAVQRQKQGLPVINRTMEKGYTFVMSLMINEMVLVDGEYGGFAFKTTELAWDEDKKAFKDKNSDTYFTNADLSPFLYRVQYIDSAQFTIALRHHLVATLKNEKGEEVGRKFAKPNTFKGIKVKISPLGEISPA